MDYNNEQIGSMRLSFPKSLLFNTFSVEEAKKLSVVKVVTPLSFNALGHPLPGGLYDPAMGPLTQYAVCSTCSMLQVKCGGHLGHIELPLPVINPLYHKSIGVILKMSCLECHRILIPHSAKCLLIGQLSLLHHGYIVEAQEMENKFIDLVKTASWERSKFDEEDFTAVEKINEYVRSVHLTKEVAVKEWRGEVDLRNAYIKEALSKIYKGKICPLCKSILKKISIVQNNILVPTKTESVGKGRNKLVEQDVASSNFSFLMPLDCKEHLKKLFSADGEFMKALLPVLLSSRTEDPIDSLFMDAVLVPPINARPVGRVNGVTSEHPQNAIFKSILNDCVVVRSVMHLISNSNALNESQNTSTLSQERVELVEKLRGKTNAEKLQYAWQDLQKSVDSLIDTDLHRNKVLNSTGLKQILEKKEGIIRMNMMGKRVNFAARTVITPDPNLNIDEIGVPEVFAMKLTYPVPVSYLNVNELRKLVLNGPFMHPGANFVENEDGSITKLKGDDLTQREGLAKKLLTPGEKKGIKIIHRHLMNGDILLLNRQPTLHKPSIMAHKARVLKGEKTLRLHYANCKSYNADFDGDEMNAHFPQNEVARSEGYNLVSVGKQYLVPKDGTPLSGLIQDHVVSGVRLSVRGRFFTKEEYMQLSFQGLSSVTGSIQFLPPCMIKPQQLWSGKQIISTVIINVISKSGSPLNLNSKAKISASAWLVSQKPWKSENSPFRDISEMSEAEVVIRGGELLCGVLDKMHYGATPYSLVHCVHELYGGDVACKLLNSFSKLFTAFLQTEGFTLGVEDILVVEKADAKRKEIINSMRQIGEQVAAKALGIESSTNLREDLADAHRKDPSFRSLLDHQYKTSLDSFTNDINKVCLPYGLCKKFPANDLQLMVQSGAKGSTVNTMQISCLLGQIELEGKRPPLMISGRSLPSFPPYDPTPRAGGFIDGRFMTGIQPQEFFFHCMAGREGLIDTAVKTSRSGYLQRCLVKHLEGLSVNYDLTVRDSDGSVVQFLYGEDGMEVTKCQFFSDKLMPFLADNIQALYKSELTQSLKNGSNSKGVRRHKKSIKKWTKSYGPSFYRPPNPFSLFSRQALIETSGGAPSKKTGRQKVSRKLTKAWFELNETEKEKFQNLCPPPPDPLVSKFQPDCHFGSVTEKLDGILQSYLKTHGDSVDVQMLEDVVHLKAMMGLANPGEPVGLLAAQSIGEPSTQMTLNTFHFAGRGEMNVTLGIPRLREVLMVASKNIKTPSMEIPFLCNVPKLSKKADHLRRKLTKVTLADVLEYVEVTEELQTKPLRRQLYTLKFNFLPEEAYNDNSTVSAIQILRHFEMRFMKELLRSLRGKSAKGKKLVETDKEAQGRKNECDEDDPDDPCDVGDERFKKSKVGIGTGNDHQSSDEEEGNDDDDATAARRRDRQNEEHQYSDLEDEDEEVRHEIEGVGKSGKHEEDIEEVDEEDIPSTLVDVKEAGIRVSRVTSLDNVVAYSFDTTHQRWCELTLGFPPSVGRIDFSTKLKDLAAASTISCVPGIRKAFLVTGPNGEQLLKTDGKNLGEMYNYRHFLDVNKLYTNDIHAVAETYGIEAAAKVIVKEVQDVFKVYGIAVDPRHLTLVADYMTYDGNYRPLSRVGMEGGASPLQQMSFEASTGFLKSSVLRSKRDELLSPSSRLMLGRPVTCGTSAFNLLYSLNTGNVY